MGLICPICGTATALWPILIEDDRAILPDQSTTQHTIYGKARVFAVTDDAHPHLTKYGVYDCQDCGKRFLAKRHKYDDSDWVPVYPIPRKPVPTEIPEPLRSEFEEARLCFAVGAYVACLLVCRTVVIALQRHEKVSSLKELMEKGTISQTLYKQADQVRLWGNAVGHEHIVPSSVAREDSEQLLTYMESVLNSVYVEPARFEALEQKRREIQKKSA